MAVLFEAPCAAVLIDAGGEKNDSFDSVAVLQAYLDQFFILHPNLNRNFEAVIATHPHLDHTLGLPMVVHRFGVRHFYHDGQMTSSGGEEQKSSAEYLSSLHVPVTEVSDVRNESQFGQTIRCDTQEVKIRFLSGGWTTEQGGAVGDLRDMNNHSIVTRIDFGRAAFLFPGDLEQDSLNRLASTYGASGLLRADVLQVSHHGSDSGTTQSFLTAVEPRVAVIPVGKWDDTNMWTAFKYGHPRLDVVEAISASLRGYRAKTEPVMVATGPGRFEPQLEIKALYATGWDGNVVVTATDAAEISVERQGRGVGTPISSAIVTTSLSSLPETTTSKIGIAAVWPQVVIGTREFTLSVATGPTPDVERWKNEHMRERHDLASNQGILIAASANQKIKITVGGENLPHVRRFPGDTDAISLSSLSEQSWYIAPGATEIKTAIILRANPQDGAAALSGTGQVQLSLPLTVTKTPVPFLREAWDFFKSQAPWIGTGISVIIAWISARIFKRRAAAAGKGEQEKN
jgi:competence protein ComEC